MLGVAASVLTVVCKQIQQLQAMLGPAVHRGKGMTYKTLETMCNASAWLQQCWKSCANGPKIVALRFDDHETKEMLGDVWLKRFQTLRTLNNMQQGGETDATLTCII